MHPHAVRLHLSTKIIVWAFFPGVLILGLVALVNFQAYQQVTKELVVQRNRELARLLAGQVSKELADLTGQFEDFSAELAAHAADPLWHSDQASFFKRIFPVFDGGIALYSFTSGFTEVRPGRVALPVSAGNLSLTRYLEMRLRGPEDTLVTDRIALAPAGQAVLALSVPYRAPLGPGYLLGLAEVHPSSENGFFEWMSTLGLDRRGQVYLVDGSGWVIFHPDPDEIGKDYSNHDFIRSVMAGKVGALRTHDDVGKDIVVSFAPVLGTRWGLVIQENWATLIASSRGYMGFLLFLLALGVIVPAGMVFLAVRRITRPIQELTEASREVADGKFGRMVRAPTGDEVEELAEQFNRMSGQLEGVYATLEQRVSDRTQELAAINAVASVVSSTLDLKQILFRALDKTAQALDMEAGALFLIDEAKEQFALAAARGLSKEFQAVVAALPMDERATGQAGLGERPVVRPAAGYSERDLRRAMATEGLELVVSIPLWAKGKALGVMNLCTRRPVSITPEQLEMLAAIGQQVGVAIDNARLYQEAEESAVMAERNRLARDLHDAVTQTLFSVSLIAEVLPRIWEKDRSAGLARLEEIRRLTKGALGEMRSLLIELRPQALVEAEIRDLFRQLADAFSGRELVDVNLDINGTGEPPPDVKVAFYRITQEALNNTARHASASQVNIRLAYRPEEVVLVVQDDGIGFDPRNIPPDHLGVSIMCERAASIGARLSIESATGEGTQISVRWNEWENDLSNPETVHLLPE